MLRGRRTIDAEPTPCRGRLAVVVALLVLPSCSTDSVFGPAVGDVTTDVRLVSRPLIHRVGELVTVDVEIANADNVGSVSFHLGYDPKMLRFEPPAVEGDFLNADGTATLLLAVDHEDNGVVVFGISRLGNDVGAGGQGRLASLHFRALDPGRCDFEFAVPRVKDPAVRTLPAEFAGTRVHVFR